MTTSLENDVPAWNVDNTQETNTEIPHVHAFTKYDVENTPITGKPDEDP